MTSILRAATVICGLLAAVAELRSDDAKAVSGRSAAGGGWRGKAGPCFAITHIEVEGVKQFSAGAMTASGHADINALLRDLTHLYLDKGFVSSRVYVPAQDIAKTKVLRLVAVEGTLADIYINGRPASGSGAAGSGMLATAFPGMKGKITNLRDIEQAMLRWK
jgi:hemolysin activation/secretion protein